MTLLRSLSRRTIVIAVCVVAVVWFGLPRLIHGTPYTVSLLMPSADGAFKGGRVVMRGQVIGKVTDIGVQDGKALVKVQIDADHAPLHAGTYATVKWESVLGARNIELVPGASTAPDIPSGKLITGNQQAVDIDDLLATLDGPTRKSLQTLIAQLNDTLSGKRNQQNLNTTLREAGPTFKALLQLLRGVGEDGPAIRKIVTQLHGMTQTVSNHDVALANTVNNLNRLTSQIAARQSQLSQTIAELPWTIQQATATLDKAPSSVTSARTLLRKLRPTTRQLPTLAAYANPVLKDARPALAMLPGTLSDADNLLRVTPRLLRDANATLPSVATALDKANPMVSYLRPYTPELIGWLSNWNGVFGSTDASGHYARALITTSASSIDNLARVPAGMRQDTRPQPGSIAGQTWDANGDEVS